MTARVAAAAALVLAIAAAALMLGQPFVGVNRLWPALSAADGLEHVIVAHVRAPRLVLGVIAGACLGAAGMLLQEALRNPLAVPELLGVSSGAGAAVGVCVALGVSVPGAPVVPALLGAAVGGFATLLAVRGATSPAAVLLIGAAVSAACQAIMIAAGALVDAREQGVLVRYLLGSLTGTTWQAVGSAALGTVVAMAAAVVVLPAVNLLRLGDDTASALGLRTGAARTAVLAVASLLVAVVAGPCGPIAWVGFFAVRIAQAWRPNTNAVERLAWSAVLGALVVVVADVAARTVLHPVELPVGGLTALVAVVIGLGLILRGTRTARSSS
ncbi:hypothetical protein GCM10022267_85850 [Lentzea roselyniae]|uniref:Iron complex transport system permease protein n=1 Tax=Lentzea roselyniae TaxID=531940 RepID=A0ABP7CE32_9PSEU